MSFNKSNNFYYEKSILILLIFLTSCSKVEIFHEEQIRWKIEYCIEDNQNIYSFDFCGKESAYYEVIKMKDFNVLLVYPEENTTTIIHAFKSREKILVLKFIKIG